MSRASGLAGFSTSISPPSNLNVGVVTATSLTVGGVTVSSAGVAVFNNDVGIGTTNPTSKLHIVGNTLVTGVSTATSIVVGSGGTAGAPSISPSGDPDTGVFSPGANQLAVATNGTERLRITSAGLVGIGAFAPAGLLNVSSNTAGSPSLTYNTSNIANFDYGSIQLALGINAAAPFGAFLQARDNTNAARVISLNPLGGNVGIGTVTPATALEVNGDITISDKIIHAGDTNTAIRFPAADNFTVETGGTEQMRITSDGRLVMGGITAATNTDHSICTPGRLQSDGTYSITTASSANVVIQSAGLFLRSTSSIKYKTEVENAELSYSEALVYGSRPVWYRSLSESDPSDYSYWGFIAEEVAEIDPRMVHWGDDGPEGVQYDRYVVHLVSVIQKQQQRLDVLEARIAALEA